MCENAAGLPLVEQKQCGRCGRLLPSTEFVFKDKNRSVRHSWCRSCFAAYKRDWYVANRVRHIENVKRGRGETTAVNQVRVWAYLADHPCVDCGETDPVVLEFDHIREKLGDVSYMAVSGFSWDVIEAEIAKCEVRCANCHRRKTARERGWLDRKRGVLREGGAGVRESASFYWAVSSVG